MADLLPNKYFVLAISRSHSIKKKHRYISENRLLISLLNDLSGFGQMTSRNIMQPTLGSLNFKPRFEFFSNFIFGKRILELINHIADQIMFNAKWTGAGLAYSFNRFNYCRYTGNKREARFVNYSKVCWHKRNIKTGHTLNCETEHF